LWSDANIDDDVNYGYGMRLMYLHKLKLQFHFKFHLFTTQTLDDGRDKVNIIITREK